MIPYVIINGVSSRTIDGLLIQSLPPITKPKKKTSITEIDGRDGDIVTVLGYSAYDKTLSIGLKGDYNVDDVIKYFNTSGKIIFSNELDKYYNFATYDVIDFNRLIRFKTATVNLHVQPFKYSADEPPIIKTNTGGQSILKIPVRNTGNIESRPKLKIVGNGSVSVYVNNKLIFEIELDGQIIIEDMNATDGEGNFLNRSVKGDYNKFVLPVGGNELTITGTITDVELEKYSRWI